jgi:octaprenyl-diphosphate synthase
MPTTITIKELYKPVAPQVEQVRSAVGDLWVEALRLVHGPKLPAPTIGGKLLRPALCFLSAGAIGDKNLDRFVPLATAMELLHLAALAHDDVIDSANMRRGETSLNARWDNHTAVLGGDYLVARAIAVMGEYDSCAVIINAIDSVRQMAEGELTTFGRGVNNLTEEGCLSLARQKTASLFAVTCSTAAILVKNEPLQSLHRYGDALGIAFQIVDDLLDLAQSQETLGKPSCGDLVEGKRTIPILYMRDELDDAGKQRLDDMKGKKLTEDDKDWVSQTFQDTGAKDRTEALARKYTQDARTALEEIPDNPYRDAMLGLTEFVLVRAS